MSPEEIVLQYLTITLANVYAALAYDRDHLQDINHQIEEGEAWAR